MRNGLYKLCVEEQKKEENYFFGQGLQNPELSAPHLYPCLTPDTSEDETSGDEYTYACSAKLLSETDASSETYVNSVPTFNTNTTIPTTATIAETNFGN